VSDTGSDDESWYLPRVGESKYRATPAEPADLLTVAQVMARLQIGRHTVYDLIRTRRLRSVLIGRCRRIPASALGEFLDSLTD
jgi:excisionase family DNA binding protein